MSPQPAQQNEVLGLEKKYWDAMKNDDVETALISYSIKHNGMDMLDVSTWVRENGKWICAFHSENPIQ